MLQKSAWVGPADRQEPRQTMPSDFREKEVFSFLNADTFLKSKEMQKIFITAVLSSWPYYSLLSQTIGDSYSESPDKEEATLSN